MRRLTAEAIKGIWAGIPMSWKEDFTFDEASYAKNIERILQYPIHGIYTTGSTGEFYAIEYEEFCRMVDIQADLCSRHDMPLQIGCCSDATAKTIRLIEYAASKQAVGGVQVNLPYWMELTNKEVLQFFKDIYSACPGIPLIHYNIPRAKRFLQGGDYLRILDVNPNLVGVKYTFAGSHFSQLQLSMLKTPNLSYFVGENMLASAMQIGARGCYSSMILTNPDFMLRMYAHAEKGEYLQAISMQQKLELFFEAMEAVVEEAGEGCIDPVGDKGLSVAAGFLAGHPRCRAPYLGWSDAFVQTLRIWLREHYPEFVYNNA